MQKQSDEEIAYLPLLAYIFGVLLRGECMARKHSQWQETQSAGPLAIDDFRQIECSGFANSSIRTSQAMTWYKGYLFVGTGGGPWRPMGLSHEALVERPLLSHLATKLQEQRRSEREVGTQIWRFDPRNEEWKEVYTTPWIVGINGEELPRDRGVRARAVFQGKADAEPALYFGVGSMEGQVVILRSSDGETFTESREKGLGLGNADVPSIRTLCELNGKLYTSPVGKNHDRGLLDDIRTDFPLVFESEDPYLGQWRPVSGPGFNDPTNLSIDEMAAFQGCLYAGTHNPREGYQIWKTDAMGEPPYLWRKIIDKGAYRGGINSVPVSMCVFGGTLYVGSGLEEQGRGHTDSYGPYAAELIRIHPDDSWDLIVGQQRFTPDGFKKPLSGMGPGFDDEFCQAFWRMVEYEGWLYLGTSDWRFFPAYLPRAGRQRMDLSDARLRYLEEHTQAYAGEFGLWCSADGVMWQAVTERGFSGNPNTYGIRELTPSPNGFFVATTSTKSARWGGGPEIWWGQVSI